MKRMIVIALTVLTVGFATAQDKVTFEWSKSERSENGITKSSTVNQGPGDKMEIEATNQSILGYYMIAYEGLLESQFIFPEELNYITNERYNLKFSGTKEQFIEHLNTKLRLSAKNEKNESSILVLKEIKTGNNIKKSNSSEMKTGTSKCTDEFSFRGNTNPSGILEIVATRFKCTIVLDESIERNQQYEFDCSIRVDISEEELINDFKKEGIILERGKQTIEVIKIKAQ